jgi:hypothetical protein
LVGQRRVVALAAEVPQVQIVDDLVGQLVEALQASPRRRCIARNAQRTQDQLAELMRGGDGGGVERGQRVAQSAAADLQFLCGSVEQMLHDLVVFGEAPDRRKPLPRRQLQGAWGRAVPEWLHARK